MQRISHTQVQYGTINDQAGITNEVQKNIFNILSQIFDKRYNIVQYQTKGSLGQTLTLYLDKVNQHSQKIELDSLFLYESIPTKDFENIFVNDIRIIDYNITEKKYSPPPTYQINRYVLGEGLHQQLTTEIIFSQLPSDITCKAVVLDYLDIYTYVDKDELDKLKGEVINSFYIKQKYKLMTIVDIERPSFESSQHIYLSEHLIDKDQFSYTHQYHFRYQAPSQNIYEKGYVPFYPKIFVNCVGKEDPSKDSLLVNKLYGHGYSPATLNQTGSEKILYVDVPVGNLEHKHYILLITIGTTLGLSLFLAKVIKEQSKQFN